MHHEVDVLQQLDSLLTALLQGLRQEFPLYEATLPAQRSSNCQQPCCRLLCAAAPVCCDVSELLDPRHSPSDMLVYPVLH